MNFLLLEPDYECSEGGQWKSCSREEACENGDYRFVYEENAAGDENNKESYANFYEQMNLTCEDPAKVRMIIVAYVLANLASQITAPL